MLVKTWGFYPSSSCEFLTCVVCVWFFCLRVHIGVRFCTGKIFRIINEVFWVIMVYIHETWVHCWWWEAVIKIWLNVLYFWLSDCVFVCFFKELLFLGIFFNVLFIIINKVIVIIGILHSIDLFIWVFKADWVYFGFMTSNYSLIRSWSVCISVFFKSLVLDPFLLFLWRIYSLFSFLLVNSGHLKEHFSNFPSCCIKNALINFFLNHGHDSLTLGM